MTSTNTGTVWRAFPWVLGVFLVASVGCGHQALRKAPVSQPDDLLVQLAVVQGTEVEVRLTNAARKRIAICPCVGPPDRYLIFDIVAKDNARSVAYPEILFPDNIDGRFFRCLEPGEEVVFMVDLVRWRAVWGGSQDTSHAPLNLLPEPGTYRVRARYLGTDEGGSRRCQPFSVEAGSAWQEVDAPPVGEVSTY